MRTMKRTVRLWIAAAMAAVLAFPAMPAFGETPHRTGHACCAGATDAAGVHDAGDCADGAAAHRAEPVCSDAGPGQASSCCVHCILAAQASYATGSPGARFAIESSAFVPHCEPAPFVPAGAIERLERPPTAVSS